MSVSFSSFASKAVLAKLPLVSVFALLLAIPSYAQLPAGTTDTTQPQAPKEDPLRAQANEALDKQDYPTAFKLLTTLAAKNPTDAHLLYDLALTQDALDQTSEAEATYRGAITADPTYFDPHLALGLLLARTGRLADAHAELLKATHHRQSATQSPCLPRPGPRRSAHQPWRSQRRPPFRPQDLP